MIFRVNLEMKFDKAWLKRLLWSILVMWLECRFLDTEVDSSNPDITMLCP